MAPATRRRRTEASRRSRPKPRAQPRPPGPGLETAPREPAVPASSAPHAHAVCRSCGRIADVLLIDEERGLLSALAEHRPDGWVIDGITFSLTGTCARCRTGNPP